MTPEQRRAELERERLKFAQVSEWPAEAIARSARGLVSFGWSQKEVAEIMGLPLARVKSALGDAQNASNASISCNQRGASG